MSLIYLSCAWVAGIFSSVLFSESTFNPPWALIFIGLAPLLLLFWFRQPRKPIILASLCAIAFLSGVFYSQSRLINAGGNHLQYYNERGVVQIKGLVTRDPEIRDKTTQLYLRATEIALDNKWRAATGTTLLFVSRYPTYQYGDFLLVSGKLATPLQSEDFDYKGYLAHQGVYSIMDYPQIDILERGKGFKPLAWLYSWRNRWAQTLAEILPEPQAALAQGILLGLRGNIPASVNEDFIRTGTAHLIAISGLNLTIVAGMLTGLGIWFFGRRHNIYIWLALGAIWIYALLTGMHPPVFRAVIMTSLFLIAELLGRPRSASTALFLAAAIMVGISPHVLWEAAFQMSFMAMAGLIFIFPPVQSVSRKAVSALLGREGVVPSIGNFVADSFGVSLSAIIAVWPLIAYYFGIISWVAPVATFFALLALPGIIITGALAGGLGLLFLPLAQVVAWLAWLFLAYMLLVVQGLAHLSPIRSGTISPTLVLVYYSVFALVLWLSSNRRRLLELMPKIIHLVSELPKKWVIPPLLLLALLILVTAATLPDDNLHVSFLDVGEGDAILIRRGSQQILIDGGPSPQALILELGRGMPFWDRTIELVVATHPHSDHITGLVEVLNRYKVKQLLYSDLAYSSAQYGEWLSLIERKNIKRTPANAGQRANLGEIAIEILNPTTSPLTGSESDIDNNGVALHLTMGKVSFLFTADLMWEAENELLARRSSLASTVLKVAHHGSATSTTAEFLAVVNPQLVVISVGAGNSFGHPNNQVLARLKQKVGEKNIYRTDEHGTIEFVTDGGRLWVKVGR